MIRAMEPGRNTQGNAFACQISDIAEKYDGVSQKNKKLIRLERTTREGEKGKKTQGKE